MKLSHIVLVVVLSIVTSFIFVTAMSDKVNKTEETVFDRIISTGKIRCGYINRDPYLTIDPNTGEKSGIMYDIMNEIGNRLKLDVEWIEEVSWGTYVEGLQSKRYDMMCSGGWKGAIKGKVIGYTNPIYSIPLGIWVRNNDNRFNGNFSDINNDDIKIASIDGSIIEAIAQSDFPNATVSSLPNLTDISEMLQTIVTNKTDVTFLDTYTGQEFVKNNSDTIKNIASSNPLRVFLVSYFVPHEEYRLKETINAAIDELMHSGYIDKVLDKYENGKGVFYRIAKPYEATQ